MTGICGCTTLEGCLSRRVRSSMIHSPGRLWNVGLSDLGSNEGSTQIRSLHRWRKSLLLTSIRTYCSSWLICQLIARRNRPHIYFADFHTRRNANRSRVAIIMPKGIVTTSERKLRLSFDLCSYGSFSSDLPPSHLIVSYG